MDMVPWYTSISDELDDVEAVISDALSVNNPEISEMCDYVISSGGKRIRPAICVLAHKACDGSDVKVIDVAAAFEIIHDATLIHDDINDNSEIRRGRKALHKEYTVSKAIIAGDLMFAIGFRLVGTCAGKVIDAVVNASEAMADSEFIQKDFEHTPSVTEENYMDIIRGKTAMPICMSAKVGAIMANVDDTTVDNVSKYAMDLGLAFQIIDDILDVTGDPSNTGKRVGSDIMEGKPTMPVIYAMQDKTHGKRLKELFCTTELSDNDVKEALDIIKRTDAVEKCMKRADELAASAKKSISSIPQSKYKESMVALADYIVRRDR